MTTDPIEDDFDDEGPAAREAWLRLAESSFARDWDNDLDAIYDNWRELYGIQEGEDKLRR
jgi:hypothetical protein